MATSSFYEMMTIDTPEAARNLEAAYEAYLKNGPHVIEGPSIFEKLKEGEQFLEDNPNWLKEAVAKAKARMIERGEKVPQTKEEWDEYFEKI